MYDGANLVQTVNSTGGLVAHYAQATNIDEPLAMQRGNTTSYSWDFENRLTQVTLPNSGGTVTFKYDPAGRRIQKVFTQSSKTTTTNYVYEGKGWNLIEELDGSGNLVARFAYGFRLDEPLSELQSGVQSFYQMDGMGSVTSLSGASGILANTDIYDSFGQLVASTGQQANPFLYTGREFDSETSLYFYRARYYDPSSGRFLSEDPVKFLGGINFYDYVGGNPINYRDPSGQTPIPIVIWGWWCGPNWTGGHPEQYDPVRDKNGYYRQPIDPTDAVCRDHDKCYYRCRKGFPCDKNQRAKCMRQICDGTLMLEMNTNSIMGPIVSFGIDVINDNSDAGDNAPNCPTCKNASPHSASPNLPWFVLFFDNR